MIKEEVDKIWYAATEEALRTGDPFSDCRYIFARMVARHERAECIHICQNWADELGEITSEGLAVQVCITTIKIRDNLENKPNEVSRSTDSG